MNDVLERLTTMRGIRAAAVFDEEGVCLGAHGDTTLAATGMSLRVLLSEATSRFASRATAVIARFDGGTLIVRRGRNAVLVVVGDPGIDMSIGGAGFAINIGLQVINLRLATHRPPKTSGTVPALGTIDPGVPAEALRTPPLPKLA
jgi:predicted regulator of Ras-like GTPase activity (Roadblock/LC7/MglB family)